MLSLKHRSPSLTMSLELERGNVKQDFDNGGCVEKPLHKKSRYANRPSVIWKVLTSPYLLPQR